MIHIKAPWVLPLQNYHASFFGFSVMNDELFPRLMDRESVVQAFPLVTNLLPQITLKDWARFACDHLASGWRTLPKGMMTIRNRDDYILGLFAFDVRYDLKEDRALWVDNVIVSTMPGREIILKATIGAIDALAESDRCGIIRVGFDHDIERADGDRLWVRSALEGAGYLFVGAQALKRLRK